MDDLKPAVRFFTGVFLASVAGVACWLLLAALYMFLVTV